MGKVRILIDSNKSRVIGSAKIIHMLHTTIKIKHPRYFWSVAYRKRQWDGYVKYVTETGSFSTGLLNQVIDVLKENKHKWVLEDKRESFKDLHMIRNLGGKEMRPYQIESLTSVLENTYEGIKYIRGILHEATNAGKNLIAAGIIKSFSKKRQWLFLIDNSAIYDQAKVDLKKLLPDEDVGWIRGKDIKWGRITVCMVQSLGNLIKKDPKARARLTKIDGVLVDECDTTMHRAPCKKIISFSYGAVIRIGLSGSPLCSKDKTRNQDILAYFGPVIHATTNKQLVDQGYSSKPHIKILTGNTIHKYKGDYAREYKRGIIRSKERNKKVWSVVKKQLKKNRGPIIILIKNHAHIDYLMKYCPPEIKDNFSIPSVHHKTKGRIGIFKRFNKGKTTILIASMIIRRGLNLPIMKTLINAAGGDSEANVIQLLGRGLRKQEGVKEHLYLYDFWDIGIYLRRHSFHRVKYYKAQEFEVKELYKK